MGCIREDYAGKPVIAIINTWSDANPCHSHMREMAEDVKRGVWQAGGFPIEMPALSLGETLQKPTTMLYRNLLAMETEELLRSYPADGCVLLGGCDKTTPALLMGAISMNLPAIYVRPVRCCGETGAAKCSACRPLTTYLPAGYDDPANAAHAYPVLFMHDGQNVYDDHTCCFGHTGWEINVGADGRHRRRPRPGAGGSWSPLITAGRRATTSTATRRGPRAASSRCSGLSRSTTIQPNSLAKILAARHVARRSSPARSLGGLLSMRLALAYP